MLNGTIYEETTAVGHFQIGADGRITTPSILTLLQEVVLNHTKELGYDIVRLRHEEFGWAILCWDIEIKEMPKLWNELHIRTWCQKRGRMQMQRNFSVNYMEREIMKVSSQWAFIDLEKRCAKDIGADVVALYCGEDIPPTPKEKIVRIAYKEEEIKLLSTTRIEVKRSHIDMNGHVNNVEYLKWVIDDIPDYLCADYLMETLKIAYRQECKRGDILEMKTYAVSDLEIISSLVRGDGVKVLDMATTWTKADEIPYLDFYENK